MKNKIIQKMIPKNHIEKSKSQKYNVEVKIVYNQLKIYINKIVHLSIHIDNIIGYKGYSVGKESFYIDYFTKDNVLIDTNYMNKEIWQEILKGLDRITLI